MGARRQRPRSAAPPGRERSLGGGGMGASLRSMGSEKSFLGSEKSYHSLRSQDKEFDRYLRIREGTFDLGPSESYKRPEYNALLDPVMGEYFDRGGRRRHLVKSKLVRERDFRRQGRDRDEGGGERANSSFCFFFWFFSSSAPPPPSSPPPPPPTIQRARFDPTEPNDDDVVVVVVVVVITARWVSLRYDALVCDV